MNADEYKISGAHLTFNLPEEGDALEDLGFLRRTGIQYHWSNNDYGCFDDFLADLKQSKRNNIRKVCHCHYLPVQQCCAGYVPQGVHECLSLWHGLVCEGWA